MREHSAVKFCFFVLFCYLGKKEITRTYSGILEEVANENG